MGVSLGTVSLSVYHSEMSPEEKVILGLYKGVK